MEPLPAHLQPLPAHLQPLPAHLQPLPAHLEPLPADLEPLPADLEPAPADLEPAPADFEPGAIRLTYRRGGQQRACPQPPMARHDLEWRCLFDGPAFPGAKAGAILQKQPRQQPIEFQTECSTTLAAVYFGLRRQLLQARHLSQHR